MEKGLSAWHITMLALGTVVGGSFFLGVVIGIERAGGSILISYILGGILVYFILSALSDLTISNPAPGSFRTYAKMAFGPGVGFVVGWVYWTGIVLAMSSEATAVSILLRAWFPKVSILLVGSIIIVFVTLLNLLGAKLLSRLESGLAAIKLLALIGFIILGLLLIIGFMPGTPRVGLGVITQEAWFLGGVSGIAGSMLIVMFTYAGFEVIGLAASEAKDPIKTIPKAIKNTIFLLVGLYILTIVVLLPLVPVGALEEEVSPLVTALTRYGLDWAGSIINIVLVTAILSTMLAAMFGLGRMIRSLADEGYAPSFIKSKKDVPSNGILFSGIAMLAGLFLGSILPQQVYIFLVSSGGFSLLFTYLVIVATHYSYQRKNMLPKNRNRFSTNPLTSWLVIGSLVVIIVSMPLIPGQGAGLVAGLLLIAFYSVLYIVVKKFQKTATLYGSQKREVTLSKQNLQIEAAEEFFDARMKGDEEK